MDVLFFAKIIIFLNRAAYIIILNVSISAIVSISIIWLIKTIANLDLNKYKLNIFLNIFNNIFRNATKLNLSKYNIMTLPSSIGKLSNLTNLYLGDNKLLFLPENICNLTNLTKLILSSNKLISLPNNIANLNKLTELYLCDNQLITLSENIGKLTNLSVLFLYKNKLTELPHSIGKLTNLTELYLGGNQLILLPDSIGDLHKLTKLKLWNNKLIKLPHSIGKLSNLTNLDLENNYLTELPESMCNLSNLNKLYLKGNKLKISSISILLYLCNKNLEIFKLIELLDFNNIIFDNELKNILLDLNTLPESIKIFIANMFLAKNQISFVYAMCKKHHIKNTQMSDLLQIIDNKMKLSIKDTCIICYNNTDLILYECFGHYYCLDCTILLETCSVCRIDPTINYLYKNPNINPFIDTNNIIINNYI